MKAVVVSRPGGPEVLTYTDVPTPHVKPGWSLVRVRGFGINHSEIFTRQGASPSVHFPRILGIECVGQISDTTDPDRLPVGQTVVSIMGEMGRAFDGGYAEYALLPNDQLYPVTTTLSWPDLAAVPETYYTAFGALKGLRLAPHDTLLVRGGTSGVGVAATKLARALDPTIQITGTTRSLAKAPAMQALGYSTVITDTAGHLGTNQTFTKILELIGPKTLQDSLTHLAEDGIASCTGELGGVWTVPDFEPISQIPNNAYLTSFASGDVRTTWLNELLRTIETQHIDVAPTKVFTLDQVAAAHTYLESGHSLGKVVVLP